jgi:predicted dehydrogenase
VSIAVPTEHHYVAARDAVDHGVHLLVEKPFVADRDQGVELVARARAAGLTLQVGHIERFNPAYQALEDILPGLDVIAVTATRLGPPLDRHLDDDVVLDLMIHDIDVLFAVVGDDVTRIDASATRDGQYATATVTFGSGVIGTLTASRVTQQKVRTLSITAEECQVNVDYADQSVRIHRHSLPAYVEDHGDVRYRHESVIERPHVDSGEPLKRELEAFVEAVRAGEPPVVGGEDGLMAVAFADRIRSIAAGRRRRAHGVAVR